MIEIGTPRALGSGESSAELRFYDDERRCAFVVHQDHLQLSFQSQAGSVGFLSGEIRPGNGDLFTHLRHLRDVEWWSRAHDHPEPARVARIRLDYAEMTQRAPNETPVLVIQGRSIIAEPLIDHGRQLEVQGSLAELVSELCSPFIARSTILATPLRAWVDVASSYGALRLIAESYNGLIQVDEDGSIELLDKEVARAKALAGPHPTIRDAISSTARVGERTHFSAKDGQESA